MDRWGTKRVIGLAVGMEKRRSKVSMQRVKVPVLASVHSGMLASMRYITEKYVKETVELGIG